MGATNLTYPNADSMMGGPRGTPGRLERCIQSTGEGEGTLRESDHLEDLGVEWRIILKWIFNKWNEES
jgi:hypothetical protein